MAFFAGESLACQYFPKFYTWFTDIISSEYVTNVLSTTLMVPTKYVRSMTKYRHFHYDMFSDSLSDTYLYKTLFKCAITKFNMYKTNLRYFCSSSSTWKQNYLPHPMLKILQLFSIFYRIILQVSPLFIEFTQGISGQWRSLLQSLSETWSSCYYTALLPFTSLLTL